MHVLMLFVDGVGIGVEDPAVNPCVAACLPNLRAMLGGKIPTLTHPSPGNGQATVVPLDANLGVEGLPQSGTGQTALFTGVNAAQYIGKHFGPYPYSTLRPVIRERNIFRQLLDVNRDVYFANAYPQRFFEYFKDKQTRLTVTTLSCSYCNMALHTVDALAGGKAISADITNAGWARMGYPYIEVIPPEEAGRRLVRLAKKHDFVLFEYWRTDKAGHSQNMNDAVESLEVFDGMLGGILATLDTGTLLVMTSDHGNIEDMSTKVHTRNPVPAILYGHRHREAAAALAQQPDLTRMTPLLTNLISVQ